MNYSFNYKYQDGLVDRNYHVECILEIKQKTFQSQKRICEMQPFFINGNGLIEQARGNSN